MINLTFAVSVDNDFPELGGWASPEEMAVDIDQVISSGLMRENVRPDVVHDIEIIGEHRVRVRARGLAYGGQDLWLECAKIGCDWYQDMDTAGPFFSRVAEIAAKHEATAD